MGKRTWETAVNGVASLAGNVGSLVLGIACTPFIVASLGLHAYGLWALYSSIAIYFTLTDFGLGATFVKSIAEYYTKGERARVRQVVTFGLLVYLALGAVLVPLVAFYAPRIDALFRIAPDVAPQAPRLLVAIAIYAVLSNALNVFGQALIGFGAMRKVSIAGFWSNLAFYTVALVLLRYGFALEAVIVATFVRLTVQTLLNAAAAWRSFGRLFCNPLHFEPHVIRYQFRMGAWIQVSNICSTVTNEIGRFLVGALVSVTDVSYYDVATRLTRSARALPMNFSNALLPAMSSLEADGGRQRLAYVYGRATRLFMLFTAALLGPIAGCAFPFMTLWMGSGFAPAAIVAIVLAATYFVGNLSIVGSTLLRAVGAPQYETAYGLVNAVTNVAATLLLVHRFGLYGVAGGMLAGTLAGQFYFTWIFHRTQHISLHDGLFGWIGKVVAATLAGVAADALIARMLPIHAHAGRIYALGEVTVLVSVYLVVFALAIVALRFFSREESQRAMVHLSQLSRVIRVSSRGRVRWYHRGMVSYGWEQHVLAPTPARRIAHRLLGTYDIGALIRSGAVTRALRGRSAPDSILDAGCGRGQLCFELHRRWPDAHLLGVDFENELVARCNDLAQCLDTPPHLRFEHRALPDDLRRTFGLVTCVDVLEHVEDDEGFVRSLFDATAPGGTLVLHTPATPQRRYLSDYEEQHDHVRDGYALDDLRALMQRAGYERVDVWYTFGPAGALAWEILALAKRGNLLAKVLLPAAYALAWLDGLRRPVRGNGLLAVAQKA
jgi:O-antigen/teichoic acid export membrane protein/SAM-dependent methyltransferase